MFNLFFLEFAQPYQILFQDPATPMMNGIIDLHHYIFMFLIIVLFFVLFMLFYIVMNFLYKFEVLELPNYQNKRRPFHEPITKDINYLLRIFPYFFYKESRFYLNNIAESESFRKNKAKFFASKETSLNFSLKMAANFYRKIGIMSFWNSFWNSMNKATKDLNTYTKRFRFQDNILLEHPYWIILNWVVPSNFVATAENNKFTVALIESTIDNTKSETNLPIDINLKTESAFLLALFLKSTSYNTPFSLISVTKAKQVYGRRYVPKASRKQFIRYILSYTAQEFAAVFNPYIINNIYWIQTYISIKSGLYKFTHNTIVEIIWTIIPSLILVFIGIPSFILLYAMDEIIKPDIIIKCIGHQWYWSYEVPYLERKEHEILECEGENWSNVLFYSMLQYENVLQRIYFEGLESNINHFKKRIFPGHANFASKTEFLKEYVKIFLENNPNVIPEPFRRINYNVYINRNEVLGNVEFLKYYKKAQELTKEIISYGFTFSSYMLTENDLKLGNLRLLEVDNPLFIPEKMHIDLLITANDVLHSWTIPSFGIKCDAVPGRLNHANLFVERKGVFYGQCSEICGVNHGFMPIKVVVESVSDFWAHISKKPEYINSTI